MNEVSPNSFVLDTSAVLAFAYGEPEAAYVASCLANTCYVSIVIWAEILSKANEFPIRQRSLQTDLLMLAYFTKVLS